MESFMAQEPALVASDDNQVMFHATINVDEFIVLSYSLTESNVHDSQKFTDVWDRPSSNVLSNCSLTDPTYSGEACLDAARRHLASPFYAIEKNAHQYPMFRTNHEKKGSL